MKRLENKQREYEAVFDDSFPTIPFSNKTIAEITDMIDECIAKRKNVYEIGYLSLDQDIVY